MIEKWDKFHESRVDDRIDIRSQIMSHGYWYDVEDKKGHWVWAIETYIEDVKIVVLKLKNSKSICYYMGEELLYVDSYGDDSSLSIHLFPVSQEINAYDLMMKKCKYLVPYFKNKPSEDTINNIKEIFLDINDILNSEPSTDWGYSNINSEKYDNRMELSYFPAFRRSDILSLTLTWEFNYDLYKFKEVKEEFNVCKSRVSIFCKPKDIKIIYNEYRIIISIEI